MVKLWSTCPRGSQRIPEVYNTLESCPSNWDARKIHHMSWEAWQGWRSSRKIARPGFKVNLLHINHLNKLNAITCILSLHLLGGTPLFWTGSLDIIVDIIGILHIAWTRTISIALHLMPGYPEQRRCDWCEHTRCGWHLLVIPRTVFRERCQG